MHQKSNENLDGFSRYQIQKSERIKRVGDYLISKVLHKAEEHQTSYFNLEIGCGHGHWLTSFAKSQPNELFIGIDLITKRILKAENKKNYHSLSNLFFIKAEASEFLDALPPQLKIHSTFIMFPDPWPKKRHFKKRLIQDSFLNQLSKYTTKPSQVFFKTDHTGYFEWATEIFESNHNWQSSSNNWPHHANSFFQNLFNTSHTCCYERL